MQSNGFATILLMIPVLTVPALAIFGIPQFAPVVASPLEEGLEKDKESRVGNSARHSHDELFGDIEDFGSEPAVKEEPWSKRRNASAATGKGKSGTRRSSESLESAWGDEVIADADPPRKSRRRPIASELDAVPLREVPSAKSNQKKSLILERSSREGRRDMSEGRTDNGIRLAAAADTDQFVDQAGFVDDPEPERPKTISARSRINSANGGKRRDVAAEPLSWQNAQERLNELEIRSFRLEPSHERGQFLFICSYNPPDNPRVSYRFEASADEPLRAVGKVLEQIIEWRQKR